jgi:hypothetical protein
MILCDIFGNARRRERSEWYEARCASTVVVIYRDGCTVASQIISPVNYANYFTAKQLYS